jgi:hypothetical protein
MAVIKLGDLTTFAGDPSGSYLVINDSTNTTTYKIQKEALMSGSFAGTASFALTASYSENQNLGVDTWATSSDSAYLYFPFKFNNDTKGQGTVTLTNGSSAIVGNSTNFLDTGYAGLSYWYNIIVRDSTGNWYIILTFAPVSNTSVQIYEVFSRTDVINGFLNQSARPSTWTGVSGTYEYWIVRNFSDGPFSNSIGNRSYANNYGFALGGSNVASSGFSAGFGNYVSTAGDNSAASLGAYNISSGSYNLAIGTYSQASGLGSFAGGGFYGTNFKFRQRFVTNLRRLLSSATASFNFSGNNNSQTVGHGALADFSAILGGINHNIPSTSPRSIVLGGNAIKADENRPDTAYVPNLQVTGSSFIRSNLIVTGSITGSNAVFTGNITAQRLVVQTISSSIVYSSGSNTFGDELTDVQQMTGSVRITGSLSLASGTASMTSSWAISSSYALTASSALTVTSASFLGLTDTPKTYSGQSGSVLVVSSSETGLKFAQTAFFDLSDFGAKNFVELQDAPDSYLGKAYNVLVVSSSEAALEFRGTSVIDTSDFGVKQFTELTDAPASYLGKSNSVLVVSSSEAALEFRGTSVIDTSDFGAQQFTELTDAPDSYLGKGGFLVSVSGSETGLEFIPTSSFSQSDLGAKTLLQLTDTPSTYSGKSGFLLAVSSSENQVEFVPTSSFSQSDFGAKQFTQLTDVPSTYSGKSGFLLAVSSSENQVEFVPTASLTGFFPIGIQDIYVSSDEMYPTFVSGCANLTTTYIPPVSVRTLDFDSATEENAQYAFSLPRNWDKSPIQTKLYWTVSGSQSGSVVWGISAASYTNESSLTGSLSTEYVVSSSISSSTNINITPYTNYISPSGSIETGSLIIINIARKAANANDNLNADAKLVGMSIKYAANRATAE